MHLILEGGKSDTERVELDAAVSPTFWLAQGERYEPVLSHFDEHLRDVRGAWRYRLKVEYLSMRAGHSALDVKPQERKRWKRLTGKQSWQSGVSSALRRLNTRSHRPRIEWIRVRRTAQRADERST